MSEYLVRTVGPYMLLQMFIQFIQFHSHILQLLTSNDAFPDYATVSNTIAAAYDEGSDRDVAVTQLEEWRQMIYDSTVDPDVAVFNDVFDDISIYVNSQFQNIPLKDIGTKNPNYTASLENYSNYLVRKLRSKWHLSRTSPSQWNAIAQFHDRVTARIAVWLTPEDGVQEAPFPLLCGHVLDIAWSILTLNSAAFKEVSIPTLQDGRFVLTHYDRSADGSSLCCCTIAYFIATAT